MYVCMKKITYVCMYEKNESMQHWHSQCCIWVFMRATPHTINDWSIANLFYYANPAELGDALCDPLCLPSYFEPFSAHQLRDATDFKLGLATSFCESIRSGCALKIFFFSHRV